MLHIPQTSPIHRLFDKTAPFLAKEPYFCGSLLRKRPDHRVVLQSADAVSIDT